MKFVEHRMGDRRVVRLVQKWLAAGVLEDGKRTRSEVGTVQGGSISPLLANIYLRAVVVGHYRYYGVPLNRRALGAFRNTIVMSWWRTLRRRSQTHRVTSGRMYRLAQHWLPRPTIYHPYPLVRLGVVTQGGSRMR